MSALPEPLTPADCDVREFPYMPLYVGRLRDSSFAIRVDPRAGFYAFFAWAAAWQQVPAASLPDDDAELARLLGFGRDVASFREVRDGALYGFVACADGRLYHPVVAEAALNAWKLKQAMRMNKERNTERAKKGAAKRWGTNAEKSTDARAMLDASSSNASSMRERLPIKKGKGEKGKEPSLHPRGTARPSTPDDCPQSSKIRMRLAGMIEGPSFVQWISPLRLIVSGSEVSVVAETSFNSDYVQNHFMTEFRHSARAVLGNQAAVVFRWDVTKRRAPHLPA